MYITESRKHGVLFKDIWFARMQEQYLNADFADQVRVSRVGYKPVWMYKSECDEFGTSMQMMVPRSNMAQFLSICSASSPQVLGAIVASFSVKAPEHEPKNPFADRAIRPAREHRIAYIASRISQGDFEPLERFQLNKTLRKDPEFSRLAQYAADFSAYWDSLERARILFAVPKQADFTKPVPLIFALHGYGSVPEDFLSQSLADESGAIVVAISGTNARPSGGYSWSEIADADSLHLQFAEDFVKSKLPNLVVGPRLLFGFSQGAQMSLEIAARFPERYLGAAAFSPGTLGALDLAWLKPGTTLKKRYFVVHVNNEDPRNVAWAKSDNKRLKAAGASVEFELNMAIRSHGVPANYEQHLLRWVQRSLQK